jgi:hypothetical protein
MHWIIQDNLHHEAGHTNLLHTLERFDIPHTQVKVVPFSAGLPLSERIQPLVHPDGPVMVCGSISLAQVAAQAGWTPGSFYNENHDYRVWQEHLADHLLNAHSVVCRFVDVDDRWDEFFIRPCGDTKSFTGNCYDYVEFDTWRRRVVDLHETYTTLDADTMVMYSPIKQIYREARFFVVDGEVVTASTYKIGARGHHTAEVPPSMWDYARRMVRKWQPARAYVMDLALTDDADDGYNKIVEFNCINASGFYQIDMQKFVMAIENMQFQ